MNLESILLVVHVIIAFALIGIILIQHGKGADMGTGFGSGASGSVFGSRGSASFLSKVTAGLATAFFLTSISMAVVSSRTDPKISTADEKLGPAVEQPKLSVINIDEDAVAPSSDDQQPEVKVIDEEPVSPPVNTEKEDVSTQQDDDADSSVKQVDVKTEETKPTE